MSLIAIFVGIILLDTFKNTSLDEVNILLMSCVLLCCVFRTIYTASSLYLGVFGNNAYLYKTAVLNWGALISYIILVFCALISNIAYEKVIVLIAGLTMAHWLVRLIISHSYAIKVFTDEKD
jgi:hypothetical protein